MPATQNPRIRQILVAVLVVLSFVAVYFLAQAKKARNLEAFARCLSARQAKMYGAYWCPHCAEQKEMFGGAFQYVSYVECGVVGSREEAPHCVQAGIKHFPTWQFADGERHEGAQALQALGEKTG